MATACVAAAVLPKVLQTGELKTGINKSLFTLLASQINVYHAASIWPSKPQEVQRASRLKQILCIFLQV